MTRWDINYAEAMGVVERCIGLAADYQGEVTGIETATTGLTGALPNSVLVASSVDGFTMEVVGPHLTKVLGHTDSAIRGTATACNAYQAGQLEMAAQAQTNAAAAEYPADMPGGANQTSGGNGGGE